MSARRLAAAAVVLALLIAGCGADEESTTARKPELGMLLALTGIPFSTATAEGGQDGARAVDGGTIKVTGPPTIDPPMAIKQFTDLVATRPDGVVVFPIPAELWRRPLSQAADSGVKLAGIHVPPVEGSKVPLYVGMREKEAASRLAALLAEELGADARGTIVLGIGPAGEPVNENRILGYKETLAAKLPDVRVVGPLTTGNEPVRNLEAWTQIFNRNPDALAFLGTTDQDAGSLSRLKAQRDVPALVGAFDPSVSNGALAAIADGRMVAAVEQQPYFRGYLAARVLGLAVRETKPVPNGWLDTGIEIVSRDNVDAVQERSASLENTRAFYKPRIAEMFANGLDGLPAQAARRRRPRARRALSPAQVASEASGTTAASSGSRPASSAATSIIRSS